MCHRAVVFPLVSGGSFRGAGCDLQPMLISHDRAGRDICQLLICKSVMSCFSVGYIPCWCRVKGLR